MTRSQDAVVMSPDLAMRDHEMIIDKYCHMSCSHYLHLCCMIQAKKCIKNLYFQLRFS